MSGIEIIGLVLGAFPLAISALEHKRNVAKRFQLLANFEQEWRTTLNDIRDEQVFFKQDLKILLLPLVGDDEIRDDDLEILLADPASSRWKDQDIDYALQLRLGQDESHTRFVEISRDLQMLIQKLLALIGVDKVRFHAQEAGSVIAPKQRLAAAALKNFLKQNLEYRREQLKFGLGESKREDILSEIRKNRKKLEELMERSEKIASFQKSKTVSVSSKEVRLLLQYWQHADRVYGLIHSSWGCPCKNKHCAHLWLQHRTSPTFEFKLLVLWSTQPADGQPFPPWQQQGLRITAFQGTVSRRQAALPSSMSAMSANATFGATTDAHTGPARKKLKSVRVALPDEVSNAVACSSSQAQVVRQPSQTLAAGPGAQLLHQIQKLCTAMAALDMHTSCIGALTDHERQYSVFSQPDQKVMAGEITLYEILRTLPNRRFKRADRFQAALAIASSHLQLHSTLWARKQWDSKNILFPQSRDDQTIMFDRPYVSTDFSADLCHSQGSAKRTQPSFVCLGIMLLELLFGECLEDHELWQNPGFADKMSDPLIRKMVARAWADTVEGEAGADFAAAVLWCLCDTPMTPNDDQWRRDLADKVVLPLQNCCAWIRGKSVA